MWEPGTGDRAVLHYSAAGVTEFNTIRRACLFEKLGKYPLRILRGKDGL
jgi:hypothetical protein